MKSFKIKLSTIVLSVLYCCNAVNANENVTVKPKVQDISNSSGKKRKKSTKDIALTCLKWAGILGTTAGLTAAVDETVTGNSAINEVYKKSIRSGIEEDIKKKFIDLLSPYMDLNFFATHANVKEYLIKKMVDTCVEYKAQTNKSLEDCSIFPMTIALELDLCNLFRSQLIRNGTKVFIYLPDFEKRNSANPELLKTTSGLRIYVRPRIKLQTKNQMPLIWGRLISDSQELKANGFVWWENENDKSYGTQVLNLVGTKIASKSLDTKSSEPCICDLPEFVFLIEKDNDGNVAWRLLERQKFEK